MYRSGAQRGVVSFLTALLVALAALATGQSASAAPRNQPPKFKVGDRAVWEFGGTEYPGTVDAVDPRNGWVTLNLDDKSKFGGSHRGPADQLRKLAKKKASTAKEGDNPFETSEERANKNGPRAWSDQSGKFKIEAKLVKVEDETVTLLRKDGKEITLPLKRLSDEDQDFLKAATPQGSDEGEEDEEGIARINVDATRARPLDTNKGSGDWTYEPDAAAAKPFPSTRIALGPKRSIFEKPFQVLLAAEKNQAVVVWLDEHQAKSARLQSCDIRGNQVEKTAEFVSGQVPIAMSSDAKRVVAFKIANRERHDLFLYDLDGYKLKPRFAWTPYGQSSDDKQGVASAHFVDPEHLLTLNAEGNYVLWDLSEKMRPEWQSLKTVSKRPAFSAGGKYLAATVDDGIVLIEILSGRKAGFLPLADKLNAHLAFDPTGRQLAVVTPGQVRVWDLTSREMKYDFACNCPVIEQLVWTDENTLLVDNKAVIDVPHRVQTWTYTAVQSGQLAGARYLYLEDDNRIGLLATGAVPNEEARKLVKSAQPDDLLRIKPGVAISLSVDMGQFQEVRDKVTEALKKGLEANGMRVVDQSNVRFVVTVKPGEVKQVEYRRFGAGRQTERHSVATQITSRVFEVDGVPVWTNGGEFLPTFVSMKQNETVDAAISRQIGEHIASLGNAQLPKYVANLPAGKTAGTSKAP